MPASSLDSHIIVKKKKEKKKELSNVKRGWLCFLDELLRRTAFHIIHCIFS